MGERKAPFARAIASRKRILIVDDDRNSFLGCGSHMNVFGATAERFSTACDDGKTHGWAELIVEDWSTPLTSAHGILPDDESFTYRRSVCLTNTIRLG